MLYVAKVGFVITMLTTMVMYGLRITVGKPAGRVSQIATYATMWSMAALCISQIWVAFFSIAAITAAYAKRRMYAAGIAIFLIVTMPSISTMLIVGNIQLINLSLATAATIGLLFASIVWKERYKSRGFYKDYPLYAVFAVLTFISIRNSTATNTLRVIAENFVTYIVPYLLVRNSLRDSLSIRNMVLFTIAAGMAISAIAVFESFMVWPIYQTYGQTFGTMLNAGVKMRGGMLRAAGPSINPPLSSAVLALCFVIAFTSTSLFKTKIGHRMVILVIAFGLFAMQARVGWLGAVVGSVAVLTAKRGMRAVAIYIPIIILGFGGIYGLAQVNKNFGNLVGFSADAKGSSEYREQMSDRGIEIVKAHPLIGQSRIIVENQMQDFRQGEGIVDFVNGYLSIALFAGVPGFILFLSAMIFQVFNSYTSRKIALSRGAGSLANLGFGIATSSAAMFPFIPTDYRVVLVMLLLFALANAVVMYSHINSSTMPKRMRPRRNLIAESGFKVESQVVMSTTLTASNSTLGV